MLLTWSWAHSSGFSPVLGPSPVQFRPSQRLCVCVCRQAFSGCYCVVGRGGRRHQVSPLWLIYHPPGSHIPGCLLVKDGEGKWPNLSFLQEWKPVYELWMGGSLFFHLQEFKNCSNLLWFQVFHCVIHMEGGRKQLAPLSLSLCTCLSHLDYRGKCGGWAVFLGVHSYRKRKKKGNRNTIWWFGMCCVCLLGVVMAFKRFLT